MDKNNRKIIGNFDENNLSSVVINIQLNCDGHLTLFHTWIEEKTRFWT